MTADALFTAADWRTRLQRTERLTDELVVRIRILEHRSEPGRVALTSECLHAGDRPDEMVPVMTTAQELSASSAGRAKQLFAQVVSNVIEARHQHDE
jgi:hypothetical protein